LRGTLGSRKGAWKRKDKEQREERKRDGKRLVSRDK